MFETEQFGGVIRSYCLFVINIIGNYQNFVIIKHKQKISYQNNLRNILEIGFTFEKYAIVYL